MLYLLDTEHISLLDRGGPAGQRLEARLDEADPEQIVASIISFEEQVRGWVAHIAKLRPVENQISAYEELTGLLDFYCSTLLLPFNEPAVAEFKRLQSLRLRVGTMDLKIAAIALANDATVLTRNVSDFGKVPYLRVEDWSV